MALRFADLIRQFSTSVGTGAFALTTTPIGYRSFASTLANGDTFYYSIVNLDKPAEVETGLGTWTGTGFTRDPAPAAPTNFTAGKKQVSLTVAAGFYTALQPLLAAGVFNPASLEAEIATKADAAATTAALAAKADAATTAAALAAKVNFIDLGELVDDRVALLLAQGNNITITYDDAGNVLTINATGTPVGGVPDGMLDFSAASQSGLIEIAF